MYKILYFIGAFFILGAAGNADYANDIGAYCAMSDILKPLIIGFSIIAIAEIWRRKHV